MFKTFLCSLFCFVHLFAHVAWAAKSKLFNQQNCVVALSHFSQDTRKVIDLFWEITRIPRGSGNEKGVRDFLSSLARETQHDFEIDKAGNLIVDVPATAPFSTSGGYIGLQSHMDMVLSTPGAVHTRDVAKVFANGVPNIVFEGDFIHTQGVSSLGADNGIGVATMLKYLFDRETPHPNLKLFFTVEEETTFKGATALRIPPEVKAIINLDMEDLKQVTIGCQGACRWTAQYESEVERVPSSAYVLTIDIKGFLGGHSGLDIHKNRGNVSRLVAEFLLNMSRRTPSLQVIKFLSGHETIFNKIPDAAHVEVAVNELEYPVLRAMFKRQIAAWKQTYGTETNEPIGTLKFKRDKSTGRAIAKAELTKMLQTFLILRDGPILGGPGLPNDWNLTSNQAYLIIESTNKLAQTRFGVMARAYDIESLQFFVQSSVRQARHLSNKKSVKVVHEFPPWTPEPNSPLIPIVVEALKENDVKDVSVGAVAGGLETASFASRYPEIPMISIGPDILDVHSPAERFSVSSVEKFLAVLDQVLAVIGKKVIE